MFLGSFGEVFYFFSCSTPVVRKGKLVVVDWSLMLGWGAALYCCPNSRVLKTVLMVELGGIKWTGISRRLGHRVRQE